MSISSFSIDRATARRRAYRRWPALPATQLQRQDAGALQRQAATVSGRRSLYLLGGLTIAVIALHGAILIALSRPSADELPVERVRVPPIEIEVTRPKPLPQAAVPVAPPPPVTKLPPERPPAPRQKVAPARPVQAAPVNDAPTPALSPAPSAEAVTAAPAAAPATAPAASASAAPATPAAEKVTPPRGEAGYLNNPPPNYPVVARSRGWEGQVMLSVHVLPDGRPDVVNVATSSGRKTLDDAAVKAVTGWQFVPARRGQTPVEGWVQVPIDFKLGK